MAVPRRRCCMLFLRLLLFVVSFGFLGVAVAIVLYDIYLAFELNRLLRLGERGAKDQAVGHVMTSRQRDRGRGDCCRSPITAPLPARCKGLPISSSSRQVIFRAHIFALSSTPTTLLERCLSGDQRSSSPSGRPTPGPSPCASRSGQSACRAGSPRCS